MHLNCLMQKAYCQSNFVLPKHILAYEACGLIFRLRVSQKCLKGLKSLGPRYRFYQQTDSKNGANTNLLVKDWQIQVNKNSFPGNKRSYFTKLKHFNLEMTIKSAMKAEFSQKILRILLIMVILRSESEFKYVTSQIDKNYLEIFALLKNVEIVYASL